MKSDDSFSAYFSSGTELEGTLKFSGTIRIDGEFKGKVMAAGSLHIGEEGRILGNIRIPEVIVKGEIFGNIIADEKIEIRSPAKVFGDILSPIVIIEEGAVYEGNCCMRQIHEHDGEEWGLSLKGEQKGAEPTGPDPQSVKGE